MCQSTLAMYSSLDRTTLLLLARMLSFISVYRGLLVHILFQNYTMLVIVLISTFNSVVIYIYISHRLGDRLRSLECYCVRDAAAALVVVAWLYPRVRSGCG